MKFLIVMVTGIVPTASATAFEGTKASSARNLTVLIRPVQVTGSALKEPASVRKAGRESIAVKWTRKLCSVFQTAVAMETLIWRLRRVTASLCGQGMTALRSFVTWTAVLMVTAWIMLVTASQGGLASFAI